MIILVLMIAIGIGTGPAEADSPDAEAQDQAITGTAAERGRVQVLDGTVKADNGALLRGEALFLTDIDGQSTAPITLADTYDLSYWRALRDTFNLNTVRLFVMRPPQNWPGGPGTDCFPPTYRCFQLDYPLNPPDTTLDVIDDMVDIAASLGMYIIIDYHPVGGFDRDDAVAWWNTIAPRYKDRTHVLYELANEPVAWNAAAYGTDAINFQRDLYQLIRGHAPDTHIIVWSFANATGPMKDKVDLVPEIDYSNASVGYHPYQTDQNAFNALRNAYPVFATEIGDDRLAKALTAENAGISWISLDGANNYIFGGPGSFSPDDVSWPADPDAVDSGSTPAQPTLGLQISPSQQIIPAGGSTSYQLTLTTTGTLTNAANLGVQPQPAGLDILLTPDSLVPPGNATLSLTDSRTGSNLAAVTYTLTVTAQSGDLEAQALLSLQINNNFTYLPLILK